MKKVFLILAICLCANCSLKKAEIPRGLYSREQVAVFLKDLYVLEQKIKELHLSEDSAKIVFDYYEAKLFKEHNMTDSLYRESFEYYMEDINGLTTIYEIIADSLSLEDRLLSDRNTPENDKEE